MISIKGKLWIVIHLQCLVVKKRVKINRNKDKLWVAKSWNKGGEKADKYSYEYNATMWEKYDQGVTTRSLAICCVLVR